MKFIYSKFKEIIKKNNLIKKGETIIIALSGGKDSVALTILLKKLKNDIDFNLIAAYFNHKIRTDFKREENWVKEFCEKNNIKLLTDSAFVKEYVEENKLNLENGASILRYRFFNSLLDEYNNSKVFTAHTKSDATETFFIKLFRGSGLQGLSSISMIKDRQFFRPLLHFTKEQILEFLERNSISYYNDISNSSNIFLRNRIRNKLIPEIKKIEPAIDNSIYKTIEIIKEEYNYFSVLAKDILQNELILNKILPLSILYMNHIAVQRHILREYIRGLIGNLFNISFDNLQDLLNSVNKEQNISLPGIELSIKKGFIFPADIEIKPYKYFIDNPDKDIKIAEIEKNVIFNQSKIYLKPKNNKVIIIEYDKLLFPLTIRSPKKEDKYIRINSKLNISVFEMIRSFKKPPELRNLCPVLTNSNGEIIWVFGSPIADKFKIIDRKNKNLFIEVAIHPFLK